jgi:hypothetical protein
MPNITELVVDIAGRVAKVEAMLEGHVAQVPCLSCQNREELVELRTIVKENAAQIAEIAGIHKKYAEEKCPRILDRLTKLETYRTITTAIFSIIMVAIIGAIATQIIRIG